MNEAQWLNSSRVYNLHSHVGGQASERKLRLFACACVRMIWDRLPDQHCRRAIEVAERFADDEVDEEELIDAEEAVHSQSKQGRLAQAAAWAAVEDGVAAASTAPGLVAKVIGSSGQADLFRDIFGNPFRPVTVAPAILARNKATVPRLAQAIYEDRAFDRLPILADALEDAGCHAPDILAHCRGRGPHVRGCWVLDLLLEKA